MAERRLRGRASPMTISRSLSAAACALGQRCARVTLVILLGTVLASGCASLPGAAVRTPSTALPASTETTLGRIAAVSSPDPQLSGFRLMPSGAFALNTRVELARRAQRSLDVQYYLIKNDQTGRYLLRTLRDAAQRGVRVRVLMDDLYTAGSDPLLLGLAAHPNVEVRLFNPFPAGRAGLSTRFLASLFDFARVNHRMHNKLFIADGAMAVVGGRNIADEYFMRHTLDNFIDLDTFVAGALVPQFAGQFDQYWNSTVVYPLHSIATTDLSRADLQSLFDELTGPQQAPQPETPPASDVLGYGPIAEDLDAGRLGLIWAFAKAFADSPEKAVAMSPPGRPKGECRSAQRGGCLMSTGSLSEPAENLNGVSLNVVDHILQARSEVVLSSPYLIPGRKGMDLIRQTRERGVRFGILTNSLTSTDEPVAHTGYRRYRAEMLRLGVELYEFSPNYVKHSSRRALFGMAIGGLHTKTVVIDREEVFIGSMNFSPRSELHNTEMGIVVHSPELARETLRLVNLVKLLGAHRLRLGPDGRSIEWLSNGDDGHEAHVDEPDAGFWIRVFLELLAPLAPEELL